MHPILPMKTPRRLSKIIPCGLHLSCIQSDSIKLYSSSNFAGCSVFFTHPIFEGGQTRAMIFPLTRPKGTGP